MFLLRRFIIFLTRIKQKDEQIKYAENLINNINIFCILPIIFFPIASHSFMFKTQFTCFSIYDLSINKFEGVSLCASVKLVSMKIMKRRSTFIFNLNIEKERNKQIITLIRRVCRVLLEIKLIICINICISTSKFDLIFYSLFQGDNCM